jgi:hypothetical protein
MHAWYDEGVGIVPSVSRGCGWMYWRALKDSWVARGSRLPLLDARMLERFEREKFVCFWCRFVGGYCTWMISDERWFFFVVFLHIVSLWWFH